MVHAQNNQHTFAHLPRLNIKGSPNSTSNITPSAKLNPKQKPARIVKTVPKKNQNPGKTKPNTQKSLMDYITKGKKRLNLVQLTTPDNNKKINKRIIPTDK